MKINILYEDNHLLVVEKPVNVAVQGDDSGDENLLDILKDDIKVRFNKPGNVFLGLVHRLDRPVGGVMTFAKTSKAASRLSDVIRRQAMERTYLTVVHGRLDQDSGELVHHVYKNNSENKVYVTKSSDPRGKKAILTYETIGKTEKFSLLKVQLQTGRPHQIRVQLAASGCPIYGDQKYGAHVNKHGQQIALWSYRLAFQHPTKKEEVIEVFSNPPQTNPWNAWDRIWNQ